MADFCQACAEGMFGSDTRDMAGLVSPEEWGDGKAALVLCEGCGPIHVDPQGRCVSGDCLRQGQPGHGPDLKGAAPPPG